MLSSGILNIFAHSPFKPMQKHMRLIHECVSQLKPFLVTVLNTNWEEAIAIHKEIMQKEGEADVIKKEIRLHLPVSLFMPVSRSDLLGLLTVQDKIASKAKHLSSIILTRKMQFPDAIKERYQHFLARCIAVTTQANKAINELDELVETGFRGREVQVVETMINELHQLEHESDQLEVELREELFKIEKGLDPVDVIFLYKIFDWTGDMADRAHHVGHLLESILAR